MHQHSLHLQPMRSPGLRCLRDACVRHAMRCTCELASGNVFCFLSAPVRTVTACVCATRFQKHLLRAGLLNLMMLILVCANARLIVENLLKYGVLTNPTAWIGFALPRGNLPLLLCWPALASFAAAALGIELLGHARLRAEKKARGPAL